MHPEASDKENSDRHKQFSRDTLNSLFYPNKVQQDPLIKNHSSHFGQNNQKLSNFELGIQNGKSDQVDNEIGNVGQSNENSNS